MTVEPTTAEGPMAKDKKTKVSETDIANRVAKMAQKAIGVSDSNISTKQAKSFREYMRKPMAGDDKIIGRSKYVSNEVQTAVEWSVSEILAVLDTQRRPVSFQPNTRNPADIAIATQMDDTVNHILRVSNKHVGFLLPWLKNGFMSGVSVAVVQFETREEEGLPQLIKGITDEKLVELKQQEDAGEITIVDPIGEPYDAPIPQLPPGVPPQMAMLAQQLLPKVRDVKIRKIKRNPDLKIISLPPEDFIISKDADFDQQTGGIRASLQGHKRICSRADLLDLGHDEAKVMKIPRADDDDSELAIERARETDFEQGTGDVSDDVQVYELYTRMAIDDGKARHYRITLGGDLANNPVYLSHVEVSKFYPYAAFCPYPIPNTLFGQGVSDRIGPEQAYISKMMRFVFDDLAQSSNPIKVVNPNVTNVDDALNLYPGAVVRSDNPTAGISWLDRPFTGGNSLSVVNSVAGKLDMAVGVGPNMIGLDASDLQNQTATGVSTRKNASQRLMETICRWFADTGYSYLVKIVVDALVSKPDEAQAFITRLTDNYTPIQIDDWDPDMDVTANVAYGVMNKDFNAAALQQILANQQAAIQAGLMGPEMMLATMIKAAENAGQIVTSDMFPSVEEAKQKLAAAQEEAKNAPPPPDPNAAVIEQMRVQGEIDLQVAAQKNDFESRKLIVEYDFKRDQMAQELFLEKARIEAEAKTQVDIASIQQAQAMQRNDVDIAMMQMDEQKEAMTRLTELKQAQEQAKAQAQQEGQVQQMQPPPQEMPQQPPMPPQGV
jgi:hypothetical protein